MTFGAGEIKCHYNYVTSCTGPLKSYFTGQYFKSFYTFLSYINVLCFTLHVIKFSCHFVSINQINV